MSERKHELLLIAAAMFITAVVLLYSVADSPEYNNLEAVPISNVTFRNVETTAAPSGIVNINTADLPELMTLEEIGESKANAIIEYREKNGRFRTVEEITNVNGIGPIILPKNIHRITV